MLVVEQFHPRLVRVDLLSQKQYADVSLSLEQSQLLSSIQDFFHVSGFLLSSPSFNLADFCHLIAFVLAV